MRALLTVSAQHSEEPYEYVEWIDRGERPHKPPGILNQRVP